MLILKQIVLLLITIPILAAADEDGFYRFSRAEHDFYVKFTGETLTLATDYKKLSAGPVEWKKEGGYIVVALHDGRVLYLPPYIQDRPGLSYRERSQYGPMVGRMKTVDGRMLWLADESPRMERERRPKQLPENFKFKVGSIILSPNYEETRPRIWGVAHGVESRSYFQVSFDNMEKNAITDFHWGERPHFEEQVLNPMENPPYKAVLEPVVSYERNVVGYRAFKVKSIIEPRFKHHEIWYWVLTTSGRLLEIDGKIFSAIGVREGESYAEALKRMEIESPDWEGGVWGKSRRKDLPIDTRWLDKTLDVKRLMNSKMVRVSRIIPKSECENALIQTQDEFFK